MELYVMHAFARWPDSGEHYAFASVHADRAEAVKSAEREMAAALDCAGIDGNETTSAEKEIAAAWRRGEESEAHDAILVYDDGGLMMWCNVSPATI